MTSKELKDTKIVFGELGVFIAKTNADNTYSLSIRREITEQEMMGIIYWFTMEHISQKGGKYEIKKNGEKY